MRSLNLKQIICIFMVVFKLFVQSQGIKVYQFILISEINAIIYRANQDDSFLFAYFNSEGEFTQTYQLQNFDPQLVQGYYVLHEKKVYFLQILEVVGQIMDLNQLQVNQVYQLEQFAQKDKLNLAYVFVQENIFYIYQSSYTFIQYTSWDNLILQVKEKQFDESDVFFYRTKNCVACKSHLFYKQQMHVFDSWAKFVLEIDYQQGTFLIQYFNASVRRSYITNVVGQKAIFSQDFKEYDLKIIKSIESNGVSLILVCSKSLIQFYNSKNLIELQTSEPIQKQIDEDCFIIENNLLLITSGKIVKFSYNVQKDQVDIFSKSQNFVNFKDYQMFSYKDLDKFSSKNGRLVILPSNKYSGYSYIWDSNLLFGICPNYCDYCQSDNVKICLRCQDNYLIQLNYKCDLTCPDSAILDQKESQCKCDDNSTLINNSCLCNQKFFQLKNQCITCSSNCKYCKDQTTCYACLQGYYLFPDQTCGFCDIQNGYFIQDNECIKCHQSCSSCSGTQQSQCTKCNKTMGFYQFSDLTCKKCDTNNGYFIDGGNCILCYKSCKTCFGAKNDQCQECYQNYEIDKNTCNQFQLSIESKEFPQSKVESIQKMSQSTSSALVISTSIMNSIQSIGSNSSFGILISSLTIQKLTYLYILNVLLPLQIGTALEILSGKLPSQQFVFLNVFYPHFDNSYFEYQNIKYKKEINAIVYCENQGDSFQFAYFNSEGEFTQIYQLQNFDQQLNYYVFQEKKVYFLKDDYNITGQIMDLNLLQVNQIYQLKQFAYQYTYQNYVLVQDNVFCLIEISLQKISQYTSWDNLVLQVNGKSLGSVRDWMHHKTKNCVASQMELFYKQQIHVIDSWAKVVVEIDYQQGTFLIQYFNASIRRSYLINLVGQKAIFSQDFKEYDLKIIKSIESNRVSLILVCSKSYIQFYNSKNLIELQTSEPIQKQNEEDCFIVENNLLLITSGKIVKFSYNILKDQVDIFSKSQNFVNFKDYQMFSYKDLDKFSSKNFNYKCDLTCPDTSIIDLKESRCKCDDNSTLINNSCICNQMFFQLKNQCIPCSSNCKYCKDQTICNKCLQGFYLFPDQTCGFCDVQNGYFIQDDKCIKCHQSCSSCSGTQESQCTKCNTNMGFFQFPDLTCKECNIIDGYFIDGDKCFKCHQSCQTCVGEKQNQCQKCYSGLGLYLHSDYTCRKCDTNNGSFIDGGNCISCHKRCKTCFGAKSDQCQECYENYQIDKNICYQFSLSIESKEFPQSKVESIQKLSQSTSSALVISTSIMNSLQSIGSNSSFGILISSLTIQKLTYLYILNILLPLQIGSVLEILSVNFAEYSQHIDNISYTFLVNVQFVQLIQPIYLIMILSISVYDLIRKRMVSRLLQQQNSQIDVDNINSLNLTNINQELEINAIIYCVNQGDSFQFAYFNSEGEFTQIYQLQNFDAGLSSYVLHGKKVYFLKGNQILGQMMDLNLLQVNQIYQLEQFSYYDSNNFNYVKVQFDVFYRIQSKKTEITQYDSWDNLVLQKNGIQQGMEYITIWTKNCFANAHSFLYRQQMYQYSVFYSAEEILEIDLLQGLFLIIFNLNSYLMKVDGQKLIFSLEFNEFYFKITKSIESNGVTLILICSKSFIKFFNSKNLNELKTSEPIQKQIEEDCFIVENNLLLITSGKIVKFNYNVQKGQVDIFSKSQNFVNFKEYKMFSYLELDYFSSKNGKLVVLPSSKYSGYYYIWDSNLLFGICPSYCDQCQSDNVKICLKCQDNYLIQLNYKCDLTCPDSSILDQKKSRCKCDDNSTLINNSCLCNQNFFQLKNQCIPCSSNCKNCKDQTICNECQQGYYLFSDQTCGFCDIQNGYFIRDDKCIQCHKSCSQCSGTQEDQCTKCNIDMGFYQFSDLNCKECNTIDGNFIDHDKCIKCHQSCQTCVGEKENQCQKCNNALGLYLFSDNTCRKCNTNNSYFIDGGNCIACHKNCKICFGAKNDQCQECYENYQIDKNTCLQVSLSIESKEFPQSKIESIQKMSQSTSSALVISTQIMNSLQSIGSNSSFGILISSLTIQKLTYLYILNVLLPSQIGSALEILSGDRFQFAYFNSEGEFTQIYQLQNFDPGLAELGSYNLHEKKVYFLQGSQIIGQMMDLNLLQVNQIYQLQNFSYYDSSSYNNVKVQFNIFYRIQTTLYKITQYTSWDNLVLQKNGIQQEGGYIQIWTKNCVGTQIKLLYKQQMHSFDSWGAKQVWEIDNNLLLITSGKIVKFSYNVQKDQVDIFTKSQNFVNFKDYHMFSYELLDYFSSKNGKLVVLPSSKYSGQYYIWDSNLLFGICPSYCDQCQSDNVKICLKCQDNYLIQLNYKCDLTCPDSSILDQKKSRCKCDDNSTLINNSCLCNQNFFQLKNQCIPCSSNCKNCKDQTICNECQEGYYLFQDQTCGFCDIQNGYFIRDDKCIQCHQSCSSCSGIQENQCTQCNTDMGFYQFSDLICKECNTIDGNFIDHDKCIKCHQSCQTCVGEKENQCQKCNNSLGLYLYSDNTCRKCNTNNSYFI
ncbi:hypothetical protein ABPG74_019672, partial [Tetrahymena malaccensis]